MDNITIFGQVIRFLQERNVNVVIRDERDLNTIRIREAKAKEKDKAISKKTKKAIHYDKEKENAHPMLHWPNVHGENVKKIKSHVLHTNWDHACHENEKEKDRRNAKEQEKVNPMSKGKEKMAPFGKRMTNTCQVAQNDNVISKAALAQHARREHAWVVTEQNRLTYYKLNQGKLRAELYQELSDMDSDYVRIGQRLGPILKKLLTFHQQYKNVKI
ncbi:hypothetical protein HYC85_027998 [Camellia sinensis]|uniref:Uncharacterized protein n=1 Tax=Camellia sinensis TaxID=4442 RepID=A0A7J7FUN1_CAMSI|nr:hypothetical protein HYC85_027998 [Camellia sinensis]